ncbi:TetR/AcrR family transcriptional regulator [Kineosporia sp. J2-2]|uniref:TetR/AcrR family transcriptional regulator n=1 Tax=Kineosporia corallincola TaxID=2835133 RepID=A0ABS5TBM1_9ACTN|nr:TetR/AcrR family transcriptional regulator [Kineosporia corallincola]MBT0768469.1 TetR/AcrR family transcriptional regulator [Kineosporia corallincola]
MSASRSRRPPTKGDQRERALIDAARTILREKSIGQVTIDELASTAGIARSGFYFYFESKQSLLAALIDQEIAVADAETAEWLASDGLDRDALRRCLSAGLARWKLDGRWLREAFVTPDPGPEVMQVRAALVDQGCALFRERIERDAAAGRTVAGPPALLAKMVIDLRTITFTQAYADPGASGDELVDALTDAILRLLYGVNP